MRPFLALILRQNAAGGNAGLGAEIPHVVDGDGVVYQASATISAEYAGVLAQIANMTSSVLNKETTITVCMATGEDSTLRRYKKFHGGQCVLPYHNAPWVHSCPLR